MSVLPRSNLLHPVQLRAAASRLICHVPPAVPFTDPPPKMASQFRLRRASGGTRVTWTVQTWRHGWRILHALGRRATVVRSLSGVQLQPPDIVPGTHKRTAPGRRGIASRFTILRRNASLREAKRTPRADWNDRHNANRCVSGV